MSLGFTSIELAARVDGNYNAWALLPDPVIDRKRPDYFLFPKLWQVVAVITKANVREFLEEFKKHNIHFNILPSKYRK